jgi:cell fate (sporulation/competence/biofilm development) regulator YlbF (YheA/YmcA/DUF963 family)
MALAISKLLASLLRIREGHDHGAAYVPMIEWRRRAAPVRSEAGDFPQRGLLLANECGLFWPQNIMPTKVETKTNELCQAILEQLQNGGVRQRIDTFLADATARNQYETLMTKGQALQEKQHHGETLDPVEISSFEKDRDALLRNPVASGFLDAQEEMHDLQHSVQKFVAKTIELGRLPNADELTEGGSCGHGCGCHDH